MNLTRISDLSVSAVEAAIGIPAEKWKGRCYAIACAIVEFNLVEGTAVYGHWTGPIAATSLFANRRDLGFCHHGWIILKDGRVLDPTRWVFESVDPYIFVGEDLGDVCECGHAADEHAASGWFRQCLVCEDLEDGEPFCADFQPDDALAWPYDEGGDKLRAALRTPPPKFEATEKTTRLNLTEARDHVRLLLGDTAGPVENSFTTNQLFWLANLPYAVLEHHVGEIYRALEAAGRGALIPLDNQRRAEREFPSK